MPNSKSMEEWPTPAAIVRKRYRTRRAIRTAALVLGCIAFVSAAFIAIATAISDPEELLDRSHLTMHSFPLAFLLGGGLLLATEGALVRWLAPRPREGCPWCGYAVGEVPAATCPECGGKLPQGDASSAA